MCYLRILLFATLQLCFQASSHGADRIGEKVLDALRIAGDAQTVARSRDACQLKDFPRIDSSKNALPGDNASLDVSLGDFEISLSKDVTYLELAISQSGRVTLVSGGARRSWVLPSQAKSLNDALRPHGNGGVDFRAHIYPTEDLQDLRLPAEGRFSVAPDHPDEMPTYIRVKMPKGLYMFDLEPQVRANSPKDDRKHTLWDKADRQPRVAPLLKGLKSAGIAHRDAEDAIANAVDRLSKMSDEDLCLAVLQANENALKGADSAVEAATRGLLFTIQPDTYVVHGICARLRSEKSTVYLIERSDYRVELDCFSRDGGWIWNGMFTPADAMPTANVLVTSIRRLLKFDEPTASRN